MVRKSLKSACGTKEWSFFSNCTSHCGARCTFFSNTHRPDLDAEEMAFSAKLNPSAEPVNSSNNAVKSRL